MDLIFTLRSLLSPGPLGMGLMWPPCPQAAGLWCSHGGLPPLLRAGHGSKWAWHGLDTLPGPPGLGIDPGGREGTLGALQEGPCSTPLAPPCPSSLASGLLPQAHPAGGAHATAHGPRARPPVSDWAGGLRHGGPILIGQAASFLLTLPRVAVACRQRGPVCSPCAGGGAVLPPPPHWAGDGGGGGAQSPLHVHLNSGVWVPHWALPGTLKQGGVPQAGGTPAAVGCLCNAELPPHPKLLVLCLPLPFSPPRH